MKKQLPFQTEKAKEIALWIGHYIEIDEDDGFRVMKEYSSVFKYLDRKEPEQIADMIIEWKLNNVSPFEVMRKVREEAR